MAGGRVQQQRALPCHAWTGHTMLQLARTSTTATQQDGAVDTVVQQRSRAPRGNRETRAPSLKVAKPLSAGLAHGLAGQSEGGRGFAQSMSCRRYDATASGSAHESWLAKLPSTALAGLVGNCLLPAAPPRRPASPLPGGERQGPGEVQSPHACVWRQRVVCSSPGVVYSWQGRGWGTCSSSIVTSKPTPMGSSTAPGV